MRATGIKNYVDLCIKEKDTLEERCKIMLNQKKLIKEEIKKYTDLLELVDMKLDYYDEKISKDELRKILAKKSKY